MNRFGRKKYKHAIPKERWIMRERKKKKRRKKMKTCPTCEIQWIVIKSHSEFFFFKKLVLNYFPVENAHINRNVYIRKIHTWSSSDFPLRVTSMNGLSFKLQLCKPYLFVFLKKLLLLNLFITALYESIIRKWYTGL